MKSLSRGRLALSPGKWRIVRKCKSHPAPASCRTAVLPLWIGRDVLRHCCCVVVSLLLLLLASCRTAVLPSWIGRYVLRHCCCVVVPLLLLLLLATTAFVSKNQIPAFYGHDLAKPVPALCVILLLPDGRCYTVLCAPSPAGWPLPKTLLLLCRNSSLGYRPPLRSPPPLLPCVAAGAALTSSV